MDKENFVKLIDESTKSIKQITDDAIVEVFLPLTVNLTNKFSEVRNAARGRIPRKVETIVKGGIHRYYLSSLVPVYAWGTLFNHTQTE